ncbi:MAG: hypothetical protein JOZ10_00165 [Acidobacteria bacterium]|nr:hypothetical protein [Acidobacteriota bacterium]MBV9145975.1 hypothetical protein [Acidobacteriota bacterium]
MNGTNGAIDTSTSGCDRNSRRRRAEVPLENVRYFLPKSGTSSDSPELGQEIGTEGEALVQAFKSGQVFYTVVAWRAVPEMNGSEPKIVKQALSPT